MLASSETRVRDVMSLRSRVYRERRAEIDAMDDDALVAMMVEEPTLLRRPLIVSGNDIIVGFDGNRLSALVSNAGPS